MFHIHAFQGKYVVVAAVTQQINCEQSRFDLLLTLLLNSKGNFCCVKYESIRIFVDYNSRISTAIRWEER